MRSKGRPKQQLSTHVRAARVCVVVLTPPQELLLL